MTDYNRLPNRLPNKNNTKLNFNKNSYYSKKDLFSTSEKPKIVFLKKKLSGSVLTFRKVRSGNKFLNLSKKLPQNGEYYKIDNYSQVGSMQEVRSDSDFVKKFIEEYYILAEIKGALKNLSIDKYLKVINVSMDNHLYIYSLKDDNNKTINNLKLVVDHKTMNERPNNNQVKNYNTMFYFFISNTPNRNNNNY